MKNLMKQIKGNGRRALTLGGLVASSMLLLGNTGCQTMNPQGKAFMSGLGQAALYTYATESVKAQVNPAQTNVYVNENKESYEQKRVSEPAAPPVQQRELTEKEKMIFGRMKLGKSFVFTCNYYHHYSDFANYDEFSCDNFVNVKTNFESDEKITVVSILYGEQDKEFIMKKELLDKNGDLVKMFKSISTWGWVDTDVISQGELKPGDYTIVLYGEDKYIGMEEFKVTE